MIEWKPIPYRRWIVDPIVNRVAHPNLSPCELMKYIPESTPPPQQALITGGCRGGFGTGELIAFLYARSFPEEEWGARVREAFHGMEHLG